MPRLDEVITNFVDVFLEYSAGGQGKISRGAMMMMLEKETQSPELREKVNLDDIDEAMKIIDKNHDNKVNFQEFSRFVSILARSYYFKKTGKTPKGGKGGKGGKEGRKGKGGKGGRAARKAQGEECEEEEEGEEEEGEGEEEEEEEEQADD